MRSLTRREFLTGLGASSVLIGAALIEGENLLDYSAGALEVMRSVQLSKRSETTPRLFGIDFEDLHSNARYRVARATLKFDDRVVRPVFTFTQNVNYSFIDLPNHKRESALDLISTGIVLPTGYVTGAYRRNSSGQNLDYRYCARTSSGIHYGLQEVTDRFPGLSDDYNRASGGIEISDGKLRLVDKYELQAVSAGNGVYAQMPLYLDQENKELVLDASWEHFGYKLRIGDTAYYWGAYFEVPVNADNISGFLVCDKEMVPLSYLTEVLESVADGGKFQMVLSDAGNGSSLVVRDDRGVEAYGPDGFNSHLSPAAVLAK